MAKSPKTIINDAVSMRDFMNELSMNELTTLWNAVFPDISMAQDKTATIKRMVCRILERKYAMSKCSADGR